MQHWAGWSLSAIAAAALGGGFSCACRNDDAEPRRKNLEMVAYHNPACPPLQDAVTLSLGDGATDPTGRGSATLFPSRGTITQEDVVIVTDTPDLDGDSRRDLIGYIDNPAGSSGDYDWITGVDCGDSSFWMPQLPISATEVVVQSGPPVETGWLTLAARVHPRRFDHVELYDFRGGGYSAPDRPDPSCPDALNSERAVRLHAMAGPSRSRWYLVPHPTRLPAAEVARRLDLNGDGRADLLLSFPFSGQTHPKGAYVACTHDYYVPVLAPSEERLYLDIQAVPTGSRWRELETTQPSSDSLQRDVVRWRFDGTEYVTSAKFAEARLKDR